ncbi:hypothetical protein PY257_09030 [Ramlibacter sp. H39-3-26]|nr:hypothetical protein [Ramlibacter sp. H39-3-26]
MSLELLREIAAKPLPLTVTDVRDIDRLRVLRAADLVAALLSAPGVEIGAFARVLAITPQGHEALSQSVSPGPSLQ